MARLKTWVSTGLAVLMLGVSGCSLNDALEAPSVPKQSQESNWKPVFAEKPENVQGEELYSTVFAERLLAEYNSRAGSFQATQLPKELQPIYNNMLREAAAAKQSFQEGNNTFAIQHVAQAGAYARGFQYYLDFKGAQQEEAVRRVALRLEELSQAVRKDDEEVRLLEQTATSLGDYLLVAVMEKQVGVELLDRTREEWKQVSSKQVNEDRLLGVFMNIAVLENQRDRLPELVRQVTPDAGQQAVHDRLRPWLEARLQALQAAVDQQQASYSDEGTEAHRAYQNSLYQVKAAQQAMTEGKQGYALELYWSAKADLATAPDLVKIATQGPHQKELQPNELKEVRDKALQELKKAADGSESKESEAAGNMAWFTSRLKGARVDVLAGDAKLEQQLKSSQADPVVVGEAYVSYMKAYATAHMVNSALGVNRAIQKGNLESLQ